jgi:hypothetical protein
VNAAAKGVNPKLLSKAQRLALEFLWQAPMVRNQKNWTAVGGREQGLVTVSRLRLLGLARNSRNGWCYITPKGRATVRRMLTP